MFGLLTQLLVAEIFFLWGWELGRSCLREGATELIVLGNICLYSSIENCDINYGQ